MFEVRDAAAANRMYWETDASVADIAARFDVSRRALYDVVMPIDAGHPCDACGAGLEYPNRLARRGSRATCPACGAEQTVLEAAPGTAQDPAAGELAGGARTEAAGRPDARGIDTRSESIRQRAVLLGSAAIAGIAFGTVATWLARRRD